MATKDTVTVACKLPTGLVLRLYESTVRDGVSTKTSKVLWEQELRGSGIKRDPETLLPLPGQESLVTSEGYGLTPNVDADMFELWCVEYGDADVVTKRVIFAASDRRSLQAEMRELEGEKTGLEPLDKKAKGIAPRDDKKD